MLLLVHHFQLVTNYTNLFAKTHSSSGFGQEGSPWHVPCALEIFAWKIAQYLPPGFLGRCPLKWRLHADSQSYVRIDRAHMDCHEEDQTLVFHCRELSHESREVHMERWSGRPS